MPKSSEEWRQDAVVEMLGTMIDIIGRSHCPRLYAIQQGYRTALAEEQAERIRAEQAAMPSKHCSRHWKEVTDAA